ncbi:MAG: PD40 domain-containing protein [Devosia sp.]|uniref:Calx-beta domain-containing protein n=1 Tax=unclassified Devosia TaxID=196773 RepID=UPI0019FE8286|nr:MULTISPECIES: DUF4214 domain-containing protein [unclassified Devosia]MBF0680686.1 PD40 domain-containing protein [Devosia sp.]WEJ32030.1 DUF4214 domain-containing protein [Devosia sp. SD17-2]
MASIQGIYVALFGRPADPAGLAFWNGVTNQGADLSGLIGTLTGTPEYLDRFESQTPSEIVSSIYLALFGRAPDPEGLAFFTAALDSGAQTIETITINIFDGAQNDDQDTVTAKMEAADAFTASLDTPEEIAAYNGADAAALARKFLEAIDRDNPFTPSPDEDLAAKVLTPPAGADSSGGDSSPTPAPGYTISVSTASAVEGSGSTITYTVTRTGSTDAATIAVALTGTATLNTDYSTTLQHGELSFAENVATASFQITLIDDVVVEGNETITATISNPTDGIAIKTASATATIVDDETITNLTAHATGYAGSMAGQMSIDGSVIAFASLSRGIDPNVTETNEIMDVFVLRDGTYTNITAGGAANSFFPEISGDGSTVVFGSSAQNLIADAQETNGYENIFVYRAGALTNITAHANGSSSGPGVSADGSTIVFTSEATDLTASADENGVRDIFVSKNGTLTNITAHGNGLSGGAKISADGSTIVFYSEATNLVAGQDDTNGKADIFVYRDGVITNLTLNADGDSDHVTVSADGSTIAFKTAATNLTGAVDDNGVDDIIIYRDGVFTNITAHGDRASEAPILSADGNTILFNSRATNLVDGTNSDFDIYIYRDSTLTNLRLHGDGFTSSARLSPDGNKILFVSSATNLVPGVADTNRIADLFLYEML